MAQIFIPEHRTLLTEPSRRRLRANSQGSGLTPRIADTAKVLAVIYLALSVATTLALLLARMNLYDAVVRVMFRDEGLAYWREQALPAYLTTVERWKAANPASAPDERLLAGVRELALADARYWFACVLMLARAKMTDALLGRFLTMVARGRGLTSGIFLRGFPSPTVDAGAELEALAEWIRASNELRPLVTATPPADLPEALRSTPVGRDSLTAALVRSRAPRTLDGNLARLVAVFRLSRLGTRNRSTP